MSDTKLKDLNQLILFMHLIACELAVMDGTRHTSDYANHYYAKIRSKCWKSYIKNHIKPHYILADKAYETEPIRKCINEELDYSTKIPIKKNATWHYRLNSATIFWHGVYAIRMNVESVIFVIKRRFNGGNIVEARHPK